MRWGRWAGAALAATIGVAGLSPAVAGAAPAPDEAVIIRQVPGAGFAPERAVEALGGEVGRQLGIIDAFEASLPGDEVDDLLAHPEVLAVTPDAAVQLSGSYDGFDPSNDLGSMAWVAQGHTGAGDFWSRGYRGQGVDVALIDSGVAAVDGLTAPGKILDGPDLSFESQDRDLEHRDTFGHGTHMAGIIAGRDDAARQDVRFGETNHFVGMAPGARLVSIKVADASGATDVSQVLAAIDWVVQNRNRNGMNIRVLNLSFGTDGVQNYRFDPLTYAAEVAWRHGIVVVVAAGNRGDGSERLDNPAYDPFVIAVGGSDHRGTWAVGDDKVGAYSSWGDSTRAPDLLAPGTSVVSLRAPGSHIDTVHPGGRVGTRQFRGTGTSQAAAVVSGAAALALSQRPGMSPDQVKALLTNTARNLPEAHVRAQGSGSLDLRAARRASTPGPTALQRFPRAVGTGSLDAARGTEYLDDGTAVLDGERDNFGATFVAGTWAPAALAGTWAPAALAGTTWAGGTWNGNRWSADAWSGNRWSSAVWTGNRWSGNRWSGAVWSGNRWSGNRWSSAGWGQ